MGGNAVAATAAPAPQWATGSPEDVAAYMKWCEENQIRIADQKRQSQLLIQWEQKEAHRVEGQKKMTMTANFESLGYQIMEMKHKYYYVVTFEFL